MRRALSGVVVVLAAATLAGCARSSAEQSAPVESEPLSVGGALGATAGVLIVPVIVLIVIGGIVWFIHADDGGTPPNWARMFVFGGSILFGLCLVLWIAAIWMGVNGG